MKTAHYPHQSREIREFLPYSEDDKKFLVNLVKQFRKKQDKEFSQLSDGATALKLRDWLGINHFTSHMVKGYYIIYSDDSENPIQSIIPRYWVVVDSRYIIDTHADRYHPEDKSYRIVITKVGNKEYRLRKPSISAIKMRIRLKNLLKRKKKRKSYSEVESE